MIGSIEEALNVSDELVIDDCVSLYYVFQMSHENLKKFNAELKSNAKDKEGFYFKGERYHFYSPAAVAELIDFMILKNDKMLPDKIVMNADPRNYVNTVCVNYGSEESRHNAKLNKKAEKDRLFLMNFKK